MNLSECDTGIRVNELCRICTTNGHNMRDLFEAKDHGKTIADRIFSCTQILIQEKTDRPSRICGECTDQLETAYKFYNLVRKSEETYQNLLFSNCREIEKIVNPVEVLEVKIEIDDDKSFADQIKPNTSQFEFEAVEKESQRTSRGNTTASKMTKNPKHKNSSTQKRLKAATRFECYKCRAQMTSFWKTSVHLKQHDAEEKFKCIVCGIKYILWDDFSQHLCQGFAIQCSYCDESFVSTIALLNHLDISHDEKTLYKCEKCAQFFSMALLRQYHMAHAHHLNEKSDESKPFVCKTCKKGFRSKVSLRNHEEIHSDQKQLLCFECGKRFKTSSSLHQHRIGHSEKTLKCPDCPMTFNRIAGYRKHRDVHMNLKYKCNLCHAELKSKDALERHTSTLLTIFNIYLI